MKMRARDLEIVIGTLDPGPHNAITDVPGVSVGHTTLIAEEGPLRTGQGPIRTGVTVIQPHEGNIWQDPLFAGCHRLNGNGEMTGAAHSSGDIFIAFSTGNQGLPIPNQESNTGPLTAPLTMLANAYITDLFEAVVEATEEAIVNALVAAEPMTGRDGNTAYKLPPDRLIEVMSNYRHTYTSPK